MNHNVVKILKRQQSSRDCFICGAENMLGFAAQFYETESGELICLAVPKSEYQSYPGRLHGGISSALLDETMGRAILMLHPGTWGVTLEMNVKFLKPVPLEGTLRVVGRIDSDRHLFTTSGEILLEDGTVAATATARYIKLPVSKIASEADKEELLFMTEAAREIDGISREGALEIVYRP